MKYYFLAIFTLLFLTSCNSVCHPRYSYAPAPTGMAEMCIAKCYQKKTHCEHLCDIQKEHCKIQKRIDASFRYENYKEQLLARNIPNRKFLTNFDDSACACKIPCLCVNTYNLCYTECGGTVLTS